MIDPEGILKQVKQGDIPDNWHMFHYRGFSLKIIINWYASYLVVMVCGMVLINQLFGGDLLFSSKFLPAHFVWIFGGLLAACLSAWQRGRALLVLVPEGVIYPCGR